MIDWVDQELKEWGVAVGGRGVNLKFKSESIEYRLMKYGPDGLVNDSKSKQIDTIYFSDNVAKTETIVLSMCRYDRFLLVIAYTEMVSRDRQAKIFSDKVGYPVSRREFMRDLDNAHSWYCGCLRKERKYLNKKIVDSCAQKSV